MSAVVALPHEPIEEWKLPSRGIVGMACLIVAESAIFIIFVVAYLFYIGKSLTGPTPREVLEIPWFASVCLLSSSITVHFAVHSLRSAKVNLCAVWLAATVLLGGIFLAATAMEWYDLIYHTSASPFVPTCSAQLFTLWSACMHRTSLSASSCSASPSSSPSWAKSTSITPNA
jgi:heme/copper-type cytochrome/quinol oxidase subunit 3